MTTQIRKSISKDKHKRPNLAWKLKTKKLKTPSPKLRVAWNKEPSLAICMVLVAKYMNVIMLFCILHSILLSRECSPDFLPDKLSFDSRIAKQKLSNLCIINWKGRITFIHCTLIYFAHWDHAESHIIIATI